MNFLFAIPIRDEVVSDHFGYAKEFCFIDVAERVIQSTRILKTPQHDRGIVPAWLAENKVTHVIAIGIGEQAIEILNDYKVEVIWGVPKDRPEHLVKAYMDNLMAPGSSHNDH